MFSQLLEDARALRVPLIVGYSLLLAAWIAGYEQFDSPSNPSPTFRALSSVWDALGNGGRISLVTFVAVIVGQLVMNLAGDRLLAWLMSVRDGPDWDGFIEDADSAAIRYERFQIKIPSEISVSERSSRTQTTKFPSSFRAARLVAESQSRRRRRDDAVFRITLTLCIIPPLIAALCRGVELPGLLFAGFIVPVADYLLLRRQTADHLNLKRFEDRTNRRTALEDQLSKAQRDLEDGRVAGLEDHHRRQILEAEEELPGVIEELKKLEQLKVVRKAERKKAAQVPIGAEG